MQRTSSMPGTKRVSQYSFWAPSLPTSSTLEIAVRLLDLACNGLGSRRGRLHTRNVGAGGEKAAFASEDREDGVWVLIEKSEGVDGFLHHNTTK